MNKSIKLSSSNIINIRKSLDAEITKAWRIIITENVMSKKAANAGMGSGKDLKALYNTITQMQEKRIKIKGILQSLNMNITTFNFDDFKKTNNYSIFAAGEAKEAIAHWKAILPKCINPTEKSKKGIKGTGKIESFSSAKISQLIKDLQMKANKFDSNLEKFNNNTEIALDETTENDFKDALIA